MLKLHLLSDLLQFQEALLHLVREDLTPLMVVRRDHQLELLLLSQLVCQHGYLDVLNCWTTSAEGFQFNGALQVTSGVIRSNQHRKKSTKGIAVEAVLMIKLVVAGLVLATDWWLLLRHAPS